MMVLLAIFFYASMGLLCQVNFDSTTQLQRTINKVIVVG